MNASQGQNIQLFLADGSASGLRIAEIKFRSERVTAAVRSDLAKQRNLEEVQRTGIYLLLGASDDPAYERRLYIGESDDVAKRLQTHSDRAAREQGYLDWWEQTITITSNDANLTKAHALYLESALIARGKSAGRADVTNGQASDRSHTLSRADRSDMEVFLQNAYVILPLLGVDAFRPRRQVSRQETDTHEPPAPVSSTVSPVFQLSIRGRELARGQELEGTFVVQEGSTARPWSGVGGGYQPLHEKLVTAGDLAPTGSEFRFVRDMEFSSVSAAASVVSGRSANGRTSWIRVDGLGTYATWQDSVTGAAS